MDARDGVPGVHVHDDWTLPSEWHQGTAFANRDAKRNQRNRVARAIPAPPPPAIAMVSAVAAPVTVPTTASASSMGLYALPLAWSIRANVVCRMSPTALTSYSQCTGKERHDENGFAAMLRSFLAVTHKDFEFVIFGRKGINRRESPSHRLQGSHGRGQLLKGARGTAAAHSVRFWS
ncbi:unnamed protein product [Effrenium voratum]|nr:unnamed protein product [Effrenium voratum]